MLSSGDIVEVDLGTPIGSEAGLRRPGVVVTADGILQGDPNVVQVVPLTRAIRPSGAEVYIEPDGQNQLKAPQQRSVSMCGLSPSRGFLATEES